MNRFVLFGVTVLILAGSIVGLTLFPQRPLGPIDLIPRETTALLEGGDLARDWSEWRQGLVGKTVFHPDFPPFLEQLGFDRQPVDHLFSWVGALDRVVADDGFQFLFSHPSVVALLPGQLGNAHEPKAVLNCLLVVHQLDNPEVFPQVLSQFFGKITTRSTSVFQGLQLTHVQFEQGIQLSWFVHESLLVWSFDQRVIHRCANHLLQQLIPIQASIQQNSPYARLKKLSGKSVQTFAYLRLGAFTALLPGAQQGYGEERFFPDHLAISRSSTPSHGASFVASALAESGQFAFVKKHFQFRDGVAPPCRAEFSADTSLYFWTNWFKPEVFWPWLQQENERSRQSRLEQWFGGLDTAGKVTLKTFLLLFGDELELMINRLRAPHQFPLAMACMTVELRNQQLVAELLKRLLHKIQTIEVVTRGLTIQTMLLADGLLQPAYSLVNNRLIVADCVELIEKWHEQEAPGFNKAALEVQQFNRQRSNFFLFLRTGDMVEWLLPIITAIGKEYDGRPGEVWGDWFLFHPLVLSFLADLQAVETNQVHGYLDEDQARLEVSYSLAR
ncbi:hypothetical protein [Desulfobulbus propionicus]